MDIDILREMKAMLEQVMELREQRKAIVEQQDVRQQHFFAITTTIFQIILMTLGAIAVILIMKGPDTWPLMALLAGVVILAILMFTKVLRRLLVVGYLAFSRPRRRADYHEISDLEKQINDRLSVLDANRELVPESYWYTRTLGQLIFYLQSKQVWSIEEALDLVKIDDQDTRYRSKYENIYEKETALLKKLGLAYDYSLTDERKIEGVYFK
ncbi:sulfite exporter TauE/SafE family protein [Periweissella cryptocerci]|uniref:Sulfite exporter TauE/SafE family protein n=1 Tax=Periweissella cryptocerci TaxID=2506420 RepID=A0A4V1AIQ6_9LACO|nr:sulfite exporter TauE/SafE family protein [Periweissella cryptocerci]QBO36335.1 sulfite exporter TauE/SafE family protein [Periweissella cryptocerci]